jgi:WS/DGAT/MGAT family acyltransferase
MDDFFLHFERSGIPMHVGSVALYHPPAAGEDPPGFEMIRESIRRGVARAPLLRQRLVTTPLHLDRPYWADTPDLSLDQHLKRILLPSPGGWEQLRRVVTEFFEEPLGLMRPLFEVAVVESLDGMVGMPPGSFALATKVHHAVLDGVSGVEIMHAFCDAAAEAKEEAPDLEELDSEPGVALQLGRAWLHQFERGVSVAKLVARSLRTLAEARGGSSQSQSVDRQSRPVPQTRFNGRPSSSRVFGGCHLPLSEVQAIREGVPGSTVNDVILTVVGGALRTCLEEAGELPAHPVVAMAPISIRIKEEGTASKEIGGNRVSMMALGLGTDVADPLERLERVHQSASASKQSSSAAGSTTMVDLADLIPSAIGELAARAYRSLDLSSLHPTFFSCVVTNVAGPGDPLFLAGSRMTACYGLGPIFDGVGLIHPVLSYDGGITISFTSCPEMLPNPARYEELLREAFEELAIAAGARGTADVPATEGGGR